MQQKMRSTVIKLRTQQYIKFIRVISTNKFGYNGLFQLVESSCIIQGHNNGQDKQKNNLLIKQLIKGNNKNNKYFDVYAFSKSLLQINNLKTQIQQLIIQYKSLNSKILSPIVDRIQDNDMFYIVSQVYPYSLKQLVQLRQGLTEYQVIYFAMELFEVFNYYKSRQVYLEKVQLNNFYLNNDMKIIMPFNLFLNKPNKKPMIKRLPFRKQLKNLNNCPDVLQFMSKNIQKTDKIININLVNSWNIGILIYELFQNSKPFSINCDLLAQQNVSSIKYHNNQNINKKIYELKFYQNNSYEAQQLLKKLLQVDNKKRLNIPLMIIEPLFKKNEFIPHILPSTILSCPPSQQFKQSFKQQFKNKKNILKSSQSTDKLHNIGRSKRLPRHGQGFKKSQSSKILQYNRVRTLLKQQQEERKKQDVVKIDEQSSNSASINQQQEGNPVASKISPKLFTPIYQTQKYIKDSQRNLSENKVFIQQFADISHVYGFGYQMNTGMLCFVFNDETQFYYPNASRKTIVYVNQKKIRITYNSDKLPQEDEIKKKIYILQGYSKTIKKYKNQSSNQKVVYVLKYAKTKHATIFYLSNDSIQLFFNDKISFLMTKNIIYILGKNNDKYEKYDFKNQTSQLKTRRTYVISMAEKIFGWKKDKLLDQDIFDDNININNTINEENKHNKLKNKNIQNSIDQNQNNEQRQQEKRNFKKNKLQKVTHKQVPQQNLSQILIDLPSQKYVQQQDQ